MTNPLNQNQLWDKIKNGTLLIAEAGKNFIQSEDVESVEKNLENAKILARLALESGADIIKYQTHVLDDEQLNINIVSPHFKGKDRYSWVKRNEDATPLKEFWIPLKQYCDKIGIAFFSTPMSRAAAYKLMEVDVPLWKVGSGDLLDYVLLDFLRRSGRPVIFSSGMSTLEEVKKTVLFMNETKAPIALLHCVSQYPCPPEELALQTILFYKEHFNMPIGFSDHSIGTDSALAAVALGATIIEKHFSTARDLWGSDHKVSMTPDEMRTLAIGISHIKNDPEYRNKILASDIVKAGMGNGSKVLQDGEAKFRPIFRKSLMLGCDVKAGTTLLPEHLYAMRPQEFSGGLPSENYPSVLGKKLKQDGKKFDPVTWEKVI